MAKYQKGNIPHNKGKSKYPITKEELEKLLYSGMFHREIAERINAPYSNIRRLREQFEITPPEPWVKYPLPNNLSKKEEELLIGTVMGDGHMRKGKCKHASLSAEQRDKRYCFFKYNVIKRWCLSEPRRTRSDFVFNTVSHPVFDYYFDEFYKNGTKVVPIHLLEKLGVFGLFIWFQDDGHLGIHRHTKVNGDASYYYNAELATHCFSREENIVIIEFLKRKFGIEGFLFQEKRREEQFYIRFNQSNAMIINEIISRFGFKNLSQPTLLISYKATSGNRKNRKKEKNYRLVEQLVR